MITKHVHKKITWIDLESPTRDEIISISKEFDIPDLVGEELLGPTLKSKVDLYDNVIYLILHFPTVNHKHCDNTEHEIDFIIGKDFLITAHYEFIQPIYEFAKKFEVSSTLKRNSLGSHSGFILYYMLKDLYRDSVYGLDSINESLRKIEKEIFEGREGKMVHAISITRKRLLDFKQATRFHKEVLGSFEKVSKKFFGDNFSHYIDAIIAEQNKLQNTLDGHKEMLNDLRETNDSILAQKTGHTMKTLTMMSFVVFPLSLIAGIFGMNAVHMPIVGSGGDFWFILGIMLAATIGMFSYFRKKKWL